MSPGLSAALRHLFRIRGQVCHCHPQLHPTMAEVVDAIDDVANALRAELSD